MTRVPGDPKNVNVTVTLNSERPGDFVIEPDPKGSLPRGAGEQLIFKNDGNSGFWIYFNLIDNTGLGYQFIEKDKNNKKVVADAVWSVLGANNCPTTGTYDVFRARAVLHNGMTLKVRNSNVDKDELGQFTYTLRVSKDGGDHYHPLDPGGDNRNGPISAGGVSYFGALVVGLFLGIVASLGVQALLKS